MSTPRTLDLTADGLRLEVVTAGAAVRRLVVEDGSGPVDVVLGLADPADYVDDGGYLGATIGRYGNRIDAGRFPLDGTEHSLSTNQFGNTLHGGARGFDRHAWEVVDSGPDHATLALTSPDGDQGFPSRLEVTVTYRVAPGEVTLDYRARTDAPTVVNLTNHAYWALDGAGSGPVDDHVLEVPAPAVLPVREDLVPTGEVRDVAGTPLDLRSPVRIGDVLARDDEQLRFAGGLDHGYCLVVPGAGPGPDAAPRVAARLTGTSGRRLEITTDLPGVQVYTGAHFDGSQTGLDGRPIGARAGVALETQGWPDAPNHPDFPSTVLRPGEEYRTRTTWRLGRD
ncbi:aldose epimerase family protein [Phycicoccus flavus]|uniref:aldose epimerase family protein n=1 Tax=Phycicoccus flavus TaxID=2502783 RepID=UPI000FEB5E69|nr:aldose epimerase family protein [Phycicoccus flavus]NHA66499.1 galactose mutarotase [Phycicoccus flavus]